MAGLNRVMLIGNLGQDPEVRTTPSGKLVADLSIATSESFTKDGSKQERVEWHRVVFWDKQAELAQKYLSKGSRVYVEGKLQTEKWTDKEGRERTTVKIYGRDMVFLGGGQSRAEQDIREVFNAKTAEKSNRYDDDIPF